MPGKNDELDNFDSFNELNPDDGNDIKLPGPRDDGGAADEVDIEIIDDTPPRDKNAKPLAREVDDPTDEELQNYGERARKRIGELTHARHDERRRAEALQRERDEALRVSQELWRRNQEYETLIKRGTSEYSKVAVEAAEAALRAAKDKVKKAKEDFDTDAEVDALAELQAATIRLENAKKARPTPSQEGSDEVQTPQSTPAAPRQPTLDPKTQDWVNRNKWFADPQHADVASYALGLHKKLVDSGYDPRSDEYFEQIDARLKARFPEVVGEAPPRREQTSTNRQQSVVAPANRAVSAKKVVLTASQVAIAKQLGVPLQEYAAQLAKEAKNG